MNTIQTEYGTIHFFHEGNEEGTIAWINTRQKPLEIKPLGIFRYSYRDVRKEKMEVSELCLVTYKHPTAPDDCHVKLEQWMERKFASYLQPLIKQTIDAVAGLQDVCLRPEYEINNETGVEDLKETPVGNEKEIS